MSWRPAHHNIDTAQRAHGKCQVRLLTQPALQTEPHSSPGGLWIVPQEDGNNSHPVPAACPKNPVLSGQTERAAKTATLSSFCVALLPPSHPELEWRHLPGSIPAGKIKGWRKSLCFHLTPTHLLRPELLDLICTLPPLDKYVCTLLNRWVAVETENS